MKKLLSIIVISLLVVIGAQISSATIYNPPASGLTSLTPWTENINAAGYNLSSVGNLIVTGLATFATTTASTSTVSGVANLQRIVTGGGGASDTDASIDAYGTTNAIFHGHNIGAQSTTAGAAIIAYAVPTGASMLSGNRLGAFVAGGSKDTSNTLGNATAISSFTTENWSATSTGAKLTFETTPNSTTTRNTALTLGQDGVATFGYGVAPRVSTLTSSSTITLLPLTFDVADLTLTSATTTFANPTFTGLYDEWSCLINLTATTTRDIVWGTAFASSTDLVIPSSIASGTTVAMFRYRASVQKLELIVWLKTFAN